MTDPAPRHPARRGMDRPHATTRAPGADVPPATAAGVPGQHRLRAVPPAPDHVRSCTPGTKGRRVMVDPAPRCVRRRHDRPRATPQGTGC